MNIYRLRAVFTTVHTPIRLGMRFFNFEEYAEYYELIFAGSASCSPIVSPVVSWNVSLGGDIGHAYC